MSRLATPDEIAQAAEYIYIPKAEADRLAADAQARRAKEAKRRNLANLGRLSVIGALAAACVAEGIALAALSPLVRVEVMHHYTRDDGTVFSSLSWRDLPESMRDMGVANVLTDYVTCREGYSSGQAGRCWDVVSALSSRQVREQFQGWYGRDNKESPQRIYGEKSSVVVDVTDVQKDPDRDGAYRVYFNRTLRTGDGLGRPEAMVAALRIRDVLNPKALPWWQRIQFNAPAIFVWEYPGAVHTSPNAGAAGR